MPDPEEPLAGEPQPVVDPVPITTSDPATWRAPAPTEPGAIFPDASFAPAAPPPAIEPPAWTRTYELPTARKVVSSGLQLAASSNRLIRRASLYIGLLALGAFGPTVVLLLLWLARLVSDPATAETLATNPFDLLTEQPGITDSLILIYVLAIVGFLLLLAISIDAQGIAIALLAGVAAEQPLRLWEAVIRARQTFWRLAGAGLMVGLTSAVVTLVVGIPFIREFDSNQGVTFISSMIGTLIVTPFAFAATGIVLGDVGAVESLRRSWRLFRARPAIALVVVLFTLVTAVIQQFALSAGLDAAIRVSELLDIGLDASLASLILPTVIVLAFIVAFGSLTFTIAAIVAAPQVAAFLGLTFHSGGLDRARVEGDAKPRGFHWVTRPMLITMLAVALIAGFGIPTINAFQPRPVSPALAYLRAAAQDAGWIVISLQGVATIEDPTGDQGAADRVGADIVGASYGYLPFVPDWLLDAAFDCDDPDVTCSPNGSDPTRFEEFGAWIFAQRMAEAPGSTTAVRREWGPILKLFNTLYAPTATLARFPDASHAVITRQVGANRDIAMLVFDGETFVERPTSARSVWTGTDLITLVPSEDIPDGPDAWDVFAYEAGTPPGPDAQDSLRDSPRSPLQLVLATPFLELYQVTPTP